MKKAAVLGSGVMGGQIAAHLANAGIPSYLLDLPSGRSTGDLRERNRIALEGLARLRQIKPDPFFLPELERLITPGNFEDDLSKLSEVDWVIEAVVENLDIKRNLLAKIASIVKPGTLISTNTSGIPVGEIARDLRPEIKKYFLGIHFFNPPRYMKLLEIIPLPETLPEVAGNLERFCSEKLGKQVVYCKDTPGFIANRLGTFVVCYVLDFLLKNQFTIEEADLLTGEVSGKPKSGTFRTLDLVGVDTFAHVAKHLYESLSADEMRSYFKVPDFVQKMVEKKWLGEKTGQGFYKKIQTGNGKTEILVLDLQSFEYRPLQKPKIPSIEMLKATEALQEKLQLLLAARDKGGEFFRKTTTAGLAYASHCIPEITGSIRDLDQAMKAGFLWEAGPFEMWDMIGLERSLPLIKQEGLNAAPWVLEMIASGKTSFYRDDQGSRLFYDVIAKQYSGVPTDPKKIILSAIKNDKNKIVSQNAGATLLELGDKVLCLEFHTKMNTLGGDILKLAHETFDRLNGNYAALVIGNQGDHFSLGANLMLVLMLIEEEEWEELEQAVADFQNINQKLKYASKPVVVAPYGRTLGGGCELVLHAPAVCASAETYIGLVEMAAGLIPAGGGTKEMLSQALANTSKEKIGNAVTSVFQTIATAKVSTSALEGIKIGYLPKDAVVVMNPNHLLCKAKEGVLAMLQQGYKPKARSKMPALGKGLYDSIAASLEKKQGLKEITEYDAFLGKQLAKVLSGGEEMTPQQVDEQHFLDLERESFLSLCGQRKTQERMQVLLKTGKPLRN